MKEKRQKGNIRKKEWRRKGIKVGEKRRMRKIYVSAKKKEEMRNEKKKKGWKNEGRKVKDERGWV